MYTQHRIIHYIETLQKPTVNIVLEGFPIATLPALIMYICVFEIGVYQFMAIEWGKQCLVMFFGSLSSDKTIFPPTWLQSWLQRGPVSSPPADRCSMCFFQTPSETICGVDLCPNISDGIWSTSKSFQPKICGATAFFFG